VAGPGNILIRVGAEAGQAVSELSKVNRALGENMTKSEKIGAALKRAAVPATIALTAIAVGAKKAIAAASDLNEQTNKTMVVFGKSGSAVVAWSKTLASSFGLSQRAALEAAGVFGNMLVPMGFTRKEAAAMSKQMVELAGDMASFNNASPEETLQALRSGLAGESEPLRKFGVFLSDARLKQQALSQGLYSGKGALDAHAKAAATMALIMKDTADAQGDFARTADSAANAQRVQAAETENLTAALGQGLLPYYQAGLKLLISLTKATAGHTGAVKVAVGVVAGLSAAILAANAAMKAWTAMQAIAKAATIAWTIAQRALNFALASNPIGLVIVAVAALAAGLYIAYKRSETFRNIVNASLNSVAAAAAALARAFGRVVDAARSAFGWIIDHWRLGAFALGPLGAGIVLLANHFDRVRSAGVGAFNAIRGAVDAVARAIAAVVDAVKNLIAWLGRIHVPKISLPHIPGTKEAGGYGYAPVPAGQAVAAGGGVTVNFYGPVDPEGSARAIARVLRAHEVRQGRAAMRRG
jgi:hypothetical protein